MWQSTISLRYVSYKNADSNLHERIGAMAMMAKNLLWSCAQFVASRPPINPQTPNHAMERTADRRTLHFCDDFHTSTPSVARLRPPSLILVSLGTQGMRVAILGNAGSGKSTLVKKLSGDFSLPLLDLDTIYWEPGQVAIERKTSDREADLRCFCSDHHHWVIEGCYADLIKTSFPWRPELVLLHPGCEVCVQNCRDRPHEACKYPTEEEQDRRLSFLLQVGLPVHVAPLDSASSSGSLTLSGLPIYVARLPAAPFPRASFSVSLAQLR
jgi:hypothetical protein